MIADEIHAAGWSYGQASYVDTRDGRQMFVADARKGEQRCICRAETLLTAYMELQEMTSKAESEG